MNTNDVYEHIFNRLMEEAAIAKNTYGIDITPIDKEDPLHKWVKDFK